MNITIIGGGNMARALLGGLIARGHGSDALAVVEIDAEARATVAARFGVATFPAIEPAAVGNADVIVIAVKPQNVRIVARELATLLKRQVVLTIAAGIRLSDLSRWLLGYRRLVRANAWVKRWLPNALPVLEDPELEGEVERELEREVERRDPLLVRALTKSLLARASGRSSAVRRFDPGHIRRTASGRRARANRGAVAMISAASGNRIPVISSTALSRIDP